MLTFIIGFILVCMSFDGVFFVCVNEFYFIFIVILLYASKRFYWSGTQCPSKDRMDNKIVVITGSNAGIGKYTAIELAKRGD